MSAGSRNRKFPALGAKKYQLHSQWIFLVIGAPCPALLEELSRFELVEYLKRARRCIPKLDATVGMPVGHAWQNNYDFNDDKDDSWKF